MSIKPSLSPIGSTVTNYLPQQYKETGRLSINHNYLHEQFADHDLILQKIKRVVEAGDFTLGKEVDALEQDFAQICESKFAIAVGSGTDAIFLSLKAIGVGPGDEVITTPFTFYATIGAIVTSGAKPVFVDVCDDANIDVGQIEDSITPRTKAIVPVHWSGRSCNLEALEGISNRHKIPIVTDACHAVKARYNNLSITKFGLANCFSFHPLKNLNIWGDGGIVVTDSSDLANTLRLLRNHGLQSRDVCSVFAYNSRLDTVQAVVARHMLAKIDHITDSRRRNAHELDRAFRSISQISVPKRSSELYEVFHLYSVYCEQRDALQRYLVEHDVDAKVHYPMPMHLQPAAQFLGHRRGDFPMAESLSMQTLSFPVHEFIASEQLERMVQLVRDFYGD